MRFRGGDAIRALVSGHPAPARAEKLLVSVQAYVDDSKSEVGEQRLVLAGYINTAEKWARFSDAWWLELRRPPSIEYMKMVEANGLRGQFAGWSATDRDNKVADLARILRHWAPVSIHASISQKRVKEVLQPIAPHVMTSAYSYCFTALMIPLAIMQANDPRLMQVPIDFMFDEQEGLGEETKFLYQAIRLQQPPKVRKVLSLEPVFRDDKLVMPLQAADMLAWHIRRHLERGDPNQFMVPEFLLATDTHTALDIDEEQIQRFAKGFAAVPGAAQLADKRVWQKHRREMKRAGLPYYVSPRAYRWHMVRMAVRHGFTRLSRKIATALGFRSE